MKVEFTEARDTVNYGQVKAGEQKDVSKEDGDAFVKQGIAKKVKETKEK